MFFYNHSIALVYDFSYIFSIEEKSLVSLFHNPKYQHCPASAAKRRIGELAAIIHRPQGRKQAAKV